MLRRSTKPDTALDQQQQELAQRETELREQMQKLQRLIEEAPRIAEEKSRRQREELLQRAGFGGSRMDVSVALQDKRYGEDDGGGRPRVSLRKQRREGRIIFLVLLIALAGAVVWLATHLRF